MKLTYKEVIESNLPQYKSETGKLLFPFSPPIYVSKITDQLHSYCLDQSKVAIETDIKHNATLASNFNKGDTFTLTEDASTNIAMGLEPHIQSYIQGSKQTDILISAEIPDLEVTRSSFWVNFQRPGDFNPPHYHSGELSFVIYLLVEDKIFNNTTEGNSPLSGEITFQAADRKTWVLNGLTFVPEDKMLLVFPSWLMHYVMPFQEESIRISMSGNFYIRDK